MEKIPKYIYRVELLNRIVGMYNDSAGEFRRFVFRPLCTVCVVISFRRPNAMKKKNKIKIDRPVVLSESHDGRSNDQALGPYADHQAAANTVEKNNYRRHWALTVM